MKLNVEAGEKSNNTNVMLLSNKGKITFHDVYFRWVLGRIHRLPTFFW